MTDRYPLWCVDTGRDTESRFIGPFKTKEAADAESYLDRESPPMRYPVRRCRRLKVSELDNRAALDLDWIIDTLDDDPAPTATKDKAWANWDYPVVTARASTDDAEDALREWADSHLETKIYICEGDE